MKRSNVLIVALIATTAGLLNACAPKKEQASTKESARESIPAFTNIDASVKQQVAGFLTDYFVLNQALIEDNLANAKTAAIGFAETTSKFDASKLDGEQLDFYHMQSSNLKMALGNLGVSPDITNARTELAAVSESMYALVKAFHPNDTPLYIQYCPMARDNRGAKWISSKKELENPYMGQMMLACGRTQETID